MSENQELSREEQNKQVFQAAAPQQQQQQQQSTTSYEVPADVVTLPSQGLVYSIDNSLANSKQIDIKCMSGESEDLLSSAALIKNGTVLSKLLESSILNRTINAATMLTGDRNAVLIALRITGYGSDYEVKITCPECDEEFEHTFNLSELELKPLGAAPIQQNLNLFEFILPKTNRTVHFQLLTGKDEQELTQAAKMRKKVTKNKNTNSVTSRLMQSIVNLDGEKDASVISKLVKNMPSEDVRALRTYINEVEPGVKMTQVCECTDCGEFSEVNVPMGLTFFWPDAR